MLNLLFIGAAFTDHSLLDLACGVFKYRQILIQRGTDRRATRLPELQCRIGIFVHEDLLYGHLPWLIQGDDFGDTVENLLQTGRKILGLYPYTAARYISNATRRGFHHAITGDTRSGVYSENSGQWFSDRN